MNTTTPSPVVFRSKIDLWLGVLLVGGAVVELSVAVAMLVSPVPWSWAIALPAAAVAGFMLWVLFGTCYTLGDNELLIRSGPFKWRVALADIEEIRPTRNPLSAPACSLDRLRIAFRRRGKLAATMVSPADKTGFLAALSQAAPHVRIESPNR
ncbi:MAG: PH domain-containing protein [Pirellulales bacterium]